MAKKKLILNESVTRRFMKLANVNANMVSNFLTEAEEEEEMMGDEPEMEMDAPEPEEMDMADEPPMDADMGLEDEEPAGGTSEVEDMVTDLLGAVAKWAESKGVKMEVEGDDAEDEGMEDMEMDMGDDVEPEGGEEPGEADMEMEMGDEDEGEGNYGKMEEAEHPDDEKEKEEDMKNEALVAEVTRRVAQRLREMAKKSK